MKWCANKTSAWANGTRQNVTDSARQKPLNYTTLLCTLAFLSLPLARASKNNSEVYSELPQFTLSKEGCGYVTLGAAHDK